MEKKRVYSWLYYAAIALVVLLFFVITYNGFWWTDDLDSFRICSFGEYIRRVWYTYLHWSGAWQLKLMQFLYCNVLEDYRICYDISNINGVITNMTGLLS